MHAESRRTLLKRAKTLRNLMLGGERSKHDPVQTRHAGEFCVEWQRPGFEPHHQECGLLQRAGELPVAQSQRQLRRFFGRRLHKLPSRLQQPLNLCFAEGPAIDAHFIQFPLERLGAWNAAEMEIHFRIVQIRRADLPFPDRVAVDVEPRFVLSAPHNGRNMLPGVGAEDSRRRRDGPIGLIVRSGCFDPQDALVVGHVQVPAVRPARCPES